MSSFIMNSGSYVDPKYLTGEDYSHGGYGVHAAHHQAGATDYYAQQQAAAAAAMQYSNYPAVGGGIGGLNSVGSHAAAAYSRDAAAMGYASYYNQCGMSPHQMQQQMAAMSGNGGGGSLGGTGGGMTPTPNGPSSGRSPVSSPQPPGSTPSSNSHLQQ